MFESTGFDAYALNMFSVYISKTKVALFGLVFSSQSELFEIA